MARAGAAAPPRSTPGPLGRLTVPLIVSGGACFLFFGLFGAWAALAPLAGGAVAPGLISPVGQRRTVQHLEGGIIARLLVRDGDVVAVGQPLVELAETQARVSHRIHLDQWRLYAATLARLRAEEQAADQVAYPDWLMADRGRPEVDEILRAQDALFATRLATLLGRQQILNARIAQLEEEAAGLAAVVDQQTHQIVLIEEEIADAESLRAKGLERKPHVLRLKRDRAGIAAERAENRAAIARLAQQVGETRLELLDLVAERRQEIAAEIDETRHKMAEVEETLIATEDVLKRTTITAPVAGVVVNRRFTTAGGVIAPGEPILDIVPAEEDLRVRLRIS